MGRSAGSLAPRSTASSVAVPPPDSPVAVVSGTAGEGSAGPPFTRSASRQVFVLLLPGATSAPLPLLAYRNIQPVGLACDLCGRTNIYILYALIIYVKSDWLSLTLLRAIWPLRGISGRPDTMEATLLEDISKLELLVAEREIDRALKTYCRGIDRRDAQLVRSVYHDDAIEDHGGAYVGGPDGYVKWLMERLRHFAGTMHSLHNTMINIRGDDANVESYCIAHHVVPIEGDQLTMDIFGCRYIDHFQNRPGAGWRIVHRIVVREWRLRQPMLSETEQPPGFALPRHDRTDLCYLERLPTREEDAEAEPSAQRWPAKWSP